MTTDPSPFRSTMFLTLALEPRMMFDGAAVATAVEVAATADNPGVKATPAAPTIAIDDSSGQQSVDLFSDVSVTLAGDTGALSSLVVTVDSSGSNQALIVDGTAITLENGLGGSTDQNNFYYTVQVSGTVTTITIDLTEKTASDVAALIDSLAYSTKDKTVESGTITVTLESLSDDDGGDTADLSAIHSTVTIDSSVNTAPVLTDGSGLEPAESFTIADLGDNAQVVYSSSGDYAYAAGDGTLSVFSIDDSGRLTLVQTLDAGDMASATDMAISADGTSIYVIDGGSSVHVFNVNASGTLSYVSSVATSNGNATGGLAISEDGAYVYVGTAYNDVVIFSRDTTTGALTYLNRAPGESGSNSRNGVIATSGDYVYVIYTTGNHSVLVYQRNEDGSLSTLASVLTGAWGYSAVDYSLAVSDDGQSLYVADPDNGTLSLYQLSGTSLSLKETTSLANVTSIALSDDGKQLYATTSSGDIAVYTVAGTGGLSLVSTLAAGTGGSDIAVSGDGLSVLVAGSGGTVSRYSLAQSLDQGSATTFADGLTLKDSNYDVLGDGAGNYNGASITVSADVSGGSFGFADGNDLTYANGVISLNGEAIATFGTSGGVLTVTFTADTTKAVANQVLQRLTYRNDSATAGSTVTLSVQASDAALTSTALAIALRVNAVPQPNADVATGYSLDTATSETAYSFTLSAGLFSDADGDSLTWSVSGLPQGLSFDATTLKISGSATEAGSFPITVTVKDASGASASLSLTLVVEQIANRAPTANTGAGTTLVSATEGTAYGVTLDGTLFSDADSLYGDSLTWSVSGLPEGLSFDAQTHAISGTVAAAGDYTLTVTATDQSGETATVTLTLRVITQAEADNRAPSLGADADTLVYTADGALTGFSQYVYSMELSSDDATLIVLGNGTNSHAITPSGNSTLYIYSRDTATGALTLVQKFVQGTADDGDDANGIEVNGLDSATSAIYSADGKHVYLVGKNAAGTYVVTVFGVNDDGTLTATGQNVVVADAAQIKQVVVSDDGGALYIISSNTLYAYRVGEDGSLVLAGTYSDSYATASAVAVDSSGNVYVLGGSKLVVYSANGDGTLTYAATGTGIGLSATSRGIVVSDAGYIYVATGSNNSVVTLHYDSESKTVTRTATASIGAQVWGLSLSADGTALYVGHLTGAVYIYSVNSDGSLTYTSTLSGAGGRAFRYAISSDGSSIYIGGFYNGTGLGQISVAAITTVSYGEGRADRIAAEVSLSDADYDALAQGAGNYNGATITLARDGTADSADVFGFADGDGLTLTGGKLYLNGEEIGTFTSAGGALSVTFAADVTTATANLVLQRITYTNASAAVGDTVNLILSVNDGYATDTLGIRLTVVAVNDAPTLTATPATDAGYTEGGAATALFSGATVSTVESGQTITSLTLTISGLKDGASESLTIDGTVIALVAGSGTTAGGTAYTVTISDTVSTVALSRSSGLSAEATATLVNAIAYANASDDPTAGTRTVTLTAIKDNGGTAYGGQDTTQLSIAASVAVTPVNDAPTLAATPATPTYTEGAAAVALFSGASVSTVESGQTITSLTLTISGLKDGASESLTIDGTAIALVAGSGTTGGGAAYSVTVSDGVATIVVSSASGLSAEATATLVDGIAYANGSSDPTTGARTVTLTAITDNGGGAATASLAVAATVTVADINTAPTLAATPATTSFAEGGSAAGLFSGTVISTVESGQLIAGLTLTVSGLKDGAGETLIIDGKTVALTDDASVTTESGLTVTVALDGATATVTIAAGDGISAAAAQTLVNGLGYANSGDDPTAGTRTVTLAAIKDDGGTENGGQDSTAPAIAAAVTVVAVNDAPTLTATGGATSYAASGAAAALFSGAAVSTVESGQGILALTLSVSGVIDDGERLIVGGTVITLADGASVAIGNGLTVTVARDGTAATVTIAAGNAISAEAAQALIDGLAYANAGSAVTFGERVVTLTAIQDDGGTAGGGVDTTSGLSIEAHVTVVNSAPLAAEPVSALPSGTPGADYSVTLSAGMFRDADGEPLVWSVEGLPEGLSFDPETLTIGGATAVAGGHIVTVTVTDPHGASASLSLTLAIVAPTDTMAVTPALPMDDGSTGSMPLGNNQAVAPSAPVTADLAGRIGTGPFGTVPALAGLAQDPNLAFQSDGEPLFPAFPAATAGTGDPANPVPWGGDWIAEVEASGSGRDTVTILLPTRGMGEGVNLRLESGLPLPAWMRFDPRTGRLTVDAARLAQLQQIRLQMQVRTDDGTLRDATLEIRTRAAEPPTAGLTPPPRLPPPDGEKHAMAEPPADLLDEARALLAALAGLPSPQGASPAFEIHPHA